uniref:V-set and immunoglobulin domain-containing protein 1 n=1 Tax=Erpetoichthys calabaricus TaxID=27687 RepID=A0A8C4SYC7_ERPCA
MLPMMLRLCPQTLNQIHTPSPRINTTAGGNVTLQCNFQTSEPLTNLFIQWQFTDTRLQHNSGSTPPKYGGRVFASAPNSATINITNMQPSDSGTYVCEVMNVPDIEGTTQASILVSVLGKSPPSKPYCAAHGTEERGHLITLTCSSNMGLPSPLYTWSKLENGVEKMGNMTFSNLNYPQTGCQTILTLDQFRVTNEPDIRQIVWCPDGGGTQPGRPGAGLVPPPDHKGATALVALGATGTELGSFTL